MGVTAAARALVIPVLIAVYIALFHLNVRDMAFESRAFPQLMMLLLLAVVVGASIGDVRRAAAGREPVGAEPLTSVTAAVVFGAIVLTFLYIFVGMPLLGFFSSTAVFVLVASRLLGTRSWLMSALIAIAVVGSFYLVFRMGFALRLPRGLFL